MHHKIFIALLFAAFCIFSVTVVSAWTVPITCQSGDYAADLAFGTDSAATVGYDPGIDIVAPNSSGETDFYFSLPLPEDNRLAEDYRPVIDVNHTEESWTLMLTTDQTEDPVTLSWNTAATPVDIAELLLTVDDVSTDMLSVSQILVPAGTSSAGITARYGIAPEAAFSADMTLGAAPLEVQFLDESTGDPLRWSWEFGDEETSVEQNPVHTYTRPGSYTVTLTVGNDAGLSTETKPGYIVVPENLLAGFSADVTTGAAPLEVAFTDQSAGDPTAWEWDFGDGSGSDLQNPVHTFADPGAYTVTLVIRDAYGSDTETKSSYITVGSPPSASFAASPTSGTAPLTVRFSDRSTGDPTAWLWDFGDRVSSTEQNPSHQYQFVGIYDVTLTVSNQYGSSTETRVDVVRVANSMPTIPGCLYPPADPDGDGCCEDLNGNGEGDFDDVVLYFTNIEWIQSNEPLPSFDFNHNGKIDFADIIRMFQII
jgi:PKD repeat protein